MHDLQVALSDVCRAWPALLPPNRMRVSEGAAQNLIIKRPGGASGPWDPLETPYMVEPVDMLASRRHSAVCFVGPAQTGKTVGLGEGWLAHNVKNDPGDMLIVQTTQDKAREYSKQRIDRAIKNSPKLWAERGALSRDDNLHDKQFRNGMWLRIAWPTATNLSSTSYRYVFGTDYDRWDDNIDGEGDGFTLMGKRTTTFLSRGMVAVESSPGRPIEDPNWRPTTKHEAPPVKGVLGIYNRSDRRRWHWKCPHCGEWLEARPGLGLFGLPSDDELLEGIRSLNIDRFAQQHARVICPSNQCTIQYAQREAMNRRGIWLPDGLTIDALDRFSGTPLTSSIAGFWLGGVAATYVTWETLIRKHLQALLEYENTGSELELQTTANTDQGIPYMSRLLREAARKAEQGLPTDVGLERYVVPDWARFVVASVDVQGGRNARFVVQVHAVGDHKRQQVIDRYPILFSKRPGVGDEFAPIDPAAYAEDWDLLTEKVVKATYRTSDSSREVRVRCTVVDTGGEDGVTERAYAWYRRLRKAGEGWHDRVRLTKGEDGKYEWFMRETMVGGKQGQGDVPLLLLNSNKLKDIVQTSLDRRVPGPGFIHFPTPRGPLNPEGWLTEAFFDELKAEIRGEDGKWVQIKPRNETLDCCCMIQAGCMALGTDRRKEFWESPPPWARLVTDPTHPDVITPEQRREEKEGDKRPGVVVIERRSRSSSYMQ